MHCTLIYGFDQMDLVFTARSLYTFNSKSPITSLILSIFLSEILFFISWNKSINSGNTLAMKYFLSLKKELLRTININLSSLESDLQWRKYYYHLNVGEHTQLPKVNSKEKFTYYIFENGYNRDLCFQEDEGDIYLTSLPVMYKKNMLTLHIKHRTTLKEKKRDRLWTLGPKEGITWVPWVFFLLRISQPWSRRIWQHENIIRHQKKKPQRNSLSLVKRPRRTDSSTEASRTLPAWVVSQETKWRFRLSAMPAK